jgi:putative tryptophan/tyrosine transport system substrate-binding protein
VGLASGKLAVRHRPEIVSRILHAAAAAAVLAIALSAAEPCAAAPAPGRHRLLYVCDCPAAMSGEERDELLLELAKLGYVQGSNLDMVRYDFDSKKGSYAELLAREIARGKIDLVLASGVRVAEAARDAKGAPPVVFWRLTDPVGFGLVATLARPQGNLTGFSRAIEKLTVKRLELLHEMLPLARRIGFVYISDNAPHRRQAAEVRAAALPLGLELRDYGLASSLWTPDRLEALFASMRKEGVEAFLLPDINVEIRALIKLADKYRLPTLYSLTHNVTDFGGLAAYATEANSDPASIADYVDRILKGAKPADLPVQEPTRFELVLNARAARDLGLSFPPRFLLRATRVVEK